MRRPTLPVPFRHTQTAVLDLTEAAQLPTTDLEVLNEEIAESTTSFIVQMSEHATQVTGMLTAQVSKLTRGVEDLSVAFQADMKVLARTLIIAGVCFTVAQALLTALIIAVFFL